MTDIGLDLLLSRTQVGKLSLKNRMIMAPMTRSRAGAGDAATPLMAEYYSQRASAGLIVSEGSQVSAQGKGYLRTPGIFTPEQITGWKQVTDAVHAEGGQIFLQLWHVGRLSHPLVQVNGGSLDAGGNVNAGEMVVFEASGEAIDIVARGATSFVLGSAVKHPHDLVMGYYSVHTSEAALEKGEKEIQRIGALLQQEGRLA